MLVLGRAEHERIMVGDDVVITVVKLQKDRVRIGIEAPADLPVHREEIYRLIQAGHGRAKENS